MSGSGDRSTPAVVCPACGRGELAPFFAMPDVPVFCNVLWPDAASARSAARGDIELGFCAHCGMLHNVRFDPARLAYSGEYENSLHFSRQFQSYAGELADRLVADHDLAGRSVVEIGCGKGDFLAMLAERGAGPCLGFDAGYAGELGELPAAVEIRREFYAADRHGELDARLLGCRHVLEHVERPAPFVAGLRPALAADGVVYFEVPNALFTVRELGIWDLIYEHCGYWSAPALTRFFRAAGVEPTRVATEFGDQFLALEGRWETGARDVAPDAGAVAELARDVEAFGEAYARHVERWNTRLGAWLDRGRRIAVWGIGSKGVTFLNVVARGAEVAHCIDLNPRKHGRHVAGTGQEVRGPDSLRGGDVDVVLIMNPVYRDEIAAELGRLGVAAEIDTV